MNKKHVAIGVAVALLVLLLFVGEDAGVLLAIGAVLSAVAMACYSAYKHKIFNPKNPKALLIVCVVIVVLLVGALPPAIQVGRFVAGVGQRLLQCVSCIGVIVVLAISLVSLLQRTSRTG